MTKAEKIYRTKYPKVDKLGQVDEEIINILNEYISQEKKGIDEVTTDRLQMGLRMIGYDLPINIIDDIIDVVELIEDKGDKVSFNDIADLKIMNTDKSFAIARMKDFIKNLDE